MVSEVHGVGRLLGHTKATEAGPVGVLVDRRRAAGGHSCDVDSDHECTNKATPEEVRRQKEMIVTGRDVWVVGKVFVLKS